MSGGFVQVQQIELTRCFVADGIQSQARKLKMDLFLFFFLFFFFFLLLAWC